MLPATFGTKAATVLNIVGGVLATVDPGVLQSPYAKWGVALYMGLNAALHAMTGNNPIVK